MGAGSVTNMSDQSPKDMTMAEAFWPRRNAPTMLVAAALGLVLAGTILLWAHYGTAVFFEMIRTGFMACFG
jgi:hypothetical protein